MNRRPCRACGKEVIFVESAETGKIVPLDTLALIFRVETHDGISKAHRVLAAEQTFVTHFATCPQAGQFSKGRAPVSLPADEADRRGAISPSDDLKGTAPDSPAGKGAG